MGKNVWIEAQSYQKKFWLARKRLPQCKSAPPIVKKWLPKKKSAKILEIGCGPKGIIFGLKNSCTKIGLDPLVSFYKKNKLIADCGKTVLVKGKGEKLPFEKNSIDAIILWDVLDQSMFPEKILSETKRCLKKNGTAIIFDNVFEKFSIPQKILKKLNVDYFKGHPNVFTGESLEVTLQKSKLEIAEKHLLKTEKKAWSFKRKIGSIFGMKLLPLVLVCKKKEI